MSPTTPTAAAPPVDPDRPVELCRPRHPLEAHAIRLALEAEGVETLVVGDNLRTAAGEVPLGHAVGPQVVVRAADFDRARAVADGLGLETLPLSDDDGGGVLRRALLAFPAIIAAAALLAILGDRGVHPVWRVAASAGVGLILLAGMIGVFRVPRAGKGNSDG